MDMFALNPSDPDNTHYHANWTGWGLLQDLLIELGCDTSQMAGSNDGNIVDAATSLAWADTISANLDRIIIEKYPAPEFVGGFEERFRVENTYTPVPRSAHQEMHEEDAADEPAQIERLEDDREALTFIESFAAFCRTSGGFEQW